MKRIIFILILIATTLFGAVTITEIDHKSGTETIGAGATSTITLSNALMNADSIAFQLEVDKTDVSATITYEYITKNSKTNNLTLSSLPAVLTLDSSQSAAFGSTVPIGAGTSRIRPYLYITNMSGSSQAVTYNVILVKTQK